MSEEPLQEMSIPMEYERVMNAPTFSQQYVHKKLSIHVSICMQGIEATTSIECGATNNFINR